MATPLYADLNDAVASSKLLFSDPIDPLWPQMKFTSRKMRYLNPATDSYSPNIEFQLGSGDKQLTLWTRGYLSLPLTITFEEDIGLDVNAIAWKSCARSALQRVTVATADGTMLMDDNTLNFSGPLRMLLERNPEWIEQVGGDVHFAVDRPADGVIGLNSRESISYPSVTKYSGIPGPNDVDDGNGLNPRYNEGFHKRATYMAKSRVGVYGHDAPYFPGQDIGDNRKVMRCRIRLPLVELGTLFRDALNFPLIGIDLNFKFYLQQSVTNFKPITLGSSVSLAEGDVKALGGACTIAVTPNGTPDEPGPRLYYEAVTFDREEALLFAQRMQQGLTKTCLIRKYDLYKDLAAHQGKEGGAQINHEVSSSVIAPHRLFVFAYPSEERAGNGEVISGGVNSSAWPSVLVTGPCGFSQLQVYANGGESIFNQPLTSLDEQYQEFLSCCHMDADGGPTSVLSYDDWRLTSRIHAIDLTRVMRSRRIEMLR